MDERLIGLAATDAERPCGDYLEALPWDPPPDPHKLSAEDFLDLL